MDSTKRRYLGRVLVFAAREILLDEIPAGERRRYLRDLSQKVVVLPNGQRKRISLSTLRRKVRQFRRAMLDRATSKGTNVPNFP